MKCPFCNKKPDCLRNVLLSEATITLNYILAKVTISKTKLVIGTTVTQYGSVFRMGRSFLTHHNRANSGNDYPEAARNYPKKFREKVLQSLS